ncbi:MAG TPA: HAMP domain-containing sensor histidine kinase [Baekduia sp.]|uniref:sensor histidine kinase n=1 Tax=Baekduia sp. TaxID=2600305 RepID=UPI002D7770D2|nr:HAMP domain-containing sensor histidine kinase [Baekduia sp.]HET6508216.1 HAMP domain-containing sensor histidine kinase [Baekduia sp.]
MTLRTRLLLALLATSVVTLAVAALALLSPLQDRLDQQSRESVSAAARATRPQLEAALGESHGIVNSDVNGILDTLSRRTDARVGLFTSLQENVYPYSGVTDPNKNDLLKIIADGRTRDTSSEDGTGVLLGITPHAKGVNVERDIPDIDQWFALMVIKSDPGGSAVDTVRSAFATAAVIGLGVALMLGIVLSTYLARRLGRLRRSALALARDGIAAPPPPQDPNMDEIGDLARALAAMQQALRRQEEARRAFVATASHELRTPLTSLQGNFELLLEDLDAGHLDTDEAADVLRGGQAQLRRLSNLASELLDLSRLDAGVELRREPVELGELSRAVGAEFALRARDRDVTIDVVPPTGPVWAAGDPGAVARMVRILIDNALRFSPSGEAIRVTAQYHGDRATLEVADHGPGVPLDEHELIFERFQRGSRTGGEGGFGLGLAIGRELARRLGGELALASRSQADGAGAHFVLTLPIGMPRGRDDEDAHGESGDAGDAPAEAPSMPELPSGD